MTRTDVEFPAHDGTTLRGWVYASRIEGEGRDAPAPGPGVVMAHGFSATKEMALDRYAEVFAAAGLTVLVYDHRSLGASDGEPRQVIDSWAQSRDYRAALTWFRARPEVDPERVGIWGSSYSGGEVIVVAAVDRRVRAVAANVPFAGLAGVDYSDTTATFAVLRDALDDPAGPGTAAANGAPAGPVAVVDSPGEAPGAGLPAFLPQPESTEWFLRAGGEGTRWENRVWLGSPPEGTPFLDPGVAIEHIAPTPLLMVVATHDTLAATDVALAAFARAGEPKQLEIVEGHHFTPYDGDAFTRVAAVTSEFFARAL